METPLVMKSSDSENDYLSVKSLKDVNDVFWSETVKLWKIALPLALSSLFQYLNISSTSIFAGHIGDIELSSFSLYHSVINSIFFSLLLGMSTALATLCGQAYGAGKFQNAGIFVQRSWIILTTTCIILLPTHIYATQILNFFGQEKQIADQAGKFAILVIPYMFSYAFNFPVQVFLQAQSKVNVILYISIVTLIVQNGLLYVFIYVFDWGIIGLAMACNISGWGFSIAQIIYAIGWCKEGWNGFSWMAFREIWDFTKISLASSAMICLEQWYGSFIILLAGKLPNPVIAVGSYSICQDIQSWDFMLLLGVHTAVSVRVSNTLGMSHPRAAKYSFLVTLFQTLLLGIIFMIVIFFTKQDFATIFTNSDDMIHAASELAYFLGITMVINSVQQTITGVVVGCGWQVMVGYINLACYYIVGLPVGYFLGFNQNLGIKGLWGGKMCGTILHILVLTIIIIKTNWTKEVEQTANRMRNMELKQPSKGHE